MVAKIQKISEVMHKAEELIMEEMKKSPQDAVLIASAFLAVTRNLYVNTLGVEGTIKMFEAVLETFLYTEQLVDQFRLEKPTIH
tara:strand:+ start:3131 stop:3382 length:252 start_codon:yes stop_codon:yes gene_type:complete